MKARFKNIFLQAKRFYQIIFENRDMEIIRSDYYSGKWISKEELQKLLVYEVKYLTDLVLFERDSSNRLLESFRIGTMEAYHMAEEKMIKSGRIY